ncbi:hypothetical protein BDP27DRAFT_1236321 [Rhodocollybia butyracea]|uniref:Uncharacterized protein n=1 Tax=Rhodocollybia butyracea TaxID=206335 RepID=A0A9P5PBC9_9AGAR|nr:hypothetical protein BDP27DRAFT_1236321 [Rhodocollybia butyracea]
MVQEQNQQVISHNSKLRNENAKLKSELALARQTKTGRNSAIAHDPLLNDELIRKMAKKYAITVYPWPTSDLFTSPPKDSLDPECPERFKDVSTFEAGLIKELHCFLDDRELRERAANYAPFRKAFIRQAKQGRTAAVSTVRGCAPMILAEVDVPASLLPTQANDLRRNSTLLKNLLEFPGSPAVSHPFSPIFYPNQVHDNTKLFMNEFQTKVWYFT